MQTKKAAVGHWGRIFEYYGMPPVTGVKHYNGPCPICGARGKFRCDDKDGSGFVDLRLWSRGRDGVVATCHG